MAGKMGRQASHYDILGLDSGAGPSEIRKAYHKMALETHPDKQHGGEAQQEEAGELFRAVQESYEVLNSPSKKKAYDKRLERTKEKDLRHKRRAERDPSCGMEMDLDIDEILSCGGSSSPSSAAPTPQSERRPRPPFRESAGCSRQGSREGGSTARESSFRRSGSGSFRKGSADGSFRKGSEGRLGRDRDRDASTSPPPTTGRTTPQRTSLNVLEPEPASPAASPGRNSHTWLYLVFLAAAVLMFAGKSTVGCHAGAFVGRDHCGIRRAVPAPAAVHITGSLRPAITMVGSCLGGTLDGEWLASGSLLGRPWYRHAQSHHVMYYDSSCDGALQTQPGWFILPPGRAAMDGPRAGKTCDAMAKIPWDSDVFPYGTETWYMKCGGNDLERVDLTVMKDASSRMDTRLS